MSSKRQVSDNAGFSSDIEAGAHAAVIVGVIGLGTHPQTFNGQVTGFKPQVAVVYEIEGQFVAEKYTDSLGKKAKLRKVVETATGKALKGGDDCDLSNIVGKACLVTIKEKLRDDRRFIQIDGITSLPKGTKPAKPTVTPFSWFGAEDKAQQPPTYDWLPFIYGKSIADTIAAAQEREAS